MDWAPSPLPQESSDFPGINDYKDTIEAFVFVLVAVVSMFLLHVLGSLRRRSSSGLLHNIVMGVDTLSYPLVGYTIGKMNSSYWYVSDYAVWAVFLLLLLGSTDCLTACRLSDIDNWKSTYVKHLLKTFFVVWVILSIAILDQQHGPDHDPRYLWAPVSLILCVGVIKWYVRIASMRTASKSYLNKNVKVIDDYTKYVSESNPLMSFDPVTMEGYRYLVAGEKHYVGKPSSKHTQWYKEEDLKITTVEEIWGCTGNLLRLNDSAEDCREKKTNKRAQSLKDLCLSMALSKMLNRRFAGLELSEAELEKTGHLVFNGLLLTSGAGNLQPHERAFTVIEEELGFVHDLYYTRYFYLYQKGPYYGVCIPVIMCGLCSWLTYLLVKHRKDSGTRLLDVTIIITAVLAFLELYQLYLYLPSGWFKVGLICSYVSRSETCLQTRTSGCLEMLIGLLLRFKAFRPWKNKLGQYCLLKEVGHKSQFRNFLHHATLGLVDNKARKKGSLSSVGLSGEVKQAIVASLLGSKGNLTLPNWVASLRKNGVHGDLSWACDAITTDSRGSVTGTILVWHIATTICQQLDAHAKEEDAATTASTLWQCCIMCQQMDVQTEDMDRVTRLAIATASTLSQYCMHLLAFAPTLLPDHISISEPILDQAIDEAGKLLRKHKKLEERCRELMTPRGDEPPLLITQGAQLAKHLLEDIKEPTLRWKVLSGFWAEMMLYVSPSDDARAHLEVLAKGGSSSRTSGRCSCTLVS